MNKYHPVIDRTKSKILSGEDSNSRVYEILVGPILSKRKALSSGRNLVEYIDKRGRIDLLRFFIDRQFKLTLFVKCKCEAAQKIVEIGCEHFFAVSGYVSAPLRTRLGVRMIAKIMPKAYIDKE